MVLKTRVALIVALLLVGFVAADTLLLFVQLRGRASTETDAAVRSIATLLPRQADPAAADRTAALAALGRQLQELGHVRHARVALYGADGALVAATPAQERTVPRLLRRVDAERKALRSDVDYRGQPLGYFVITPAAGDELAELWEEFLDNAALIGLLCVPAVLLIVWSTFRALGPLDRIRDALRSVERGHHERRLAQSGSSDVDEIIGAFNTMAEALQAADARTQMFVRKLLENDEQTRRSVAHDLHDELSPYLVAMQPLMKTLQRMPAQGIGSPSAAATIETIVEHQSRILSTLRRILEGLHPPELETVGLRGALEQLAEQSNGVGRPMAVAFEPGGEWDGFSPTIDANIFRIVRECITNAQRHSSATRCRVAVRFETAVPVVRVEVTNDGARLPANAPRVGLGTLSMRDRSLALGGDFESGPDGDHGWRVRIAIPIDIHAEAKARAA